jgi:hypothetical protein
LSSIEERRALRLRVLNAIFEASGASEHAMVTATQLMENLGLTDLELADACKYLEGEYLISCTYQAWGHLSPYWVQMTHAGIREMEESLQAPSQPTQHFPPAISVISVQGDIIGSTIQSGSPGAQQDVTVGDINLDHVRKFLDELEAQAANLDLPETEGQVLTAEIATIKAQVDSPRPKRQVIRPDSANSVVSWLLPR